MSVEGRREGEISSYVSNPGKDTQMRLVDLLSNNSQNELIEIVSTKGFTPKFCGKLVARI
jgi:hypothetical protein